MIPASDVLEFVRKRRAVTTVTVADEFDIDLQRARQKLHRLHCAGKLTKRLVPRGRTRVLVWKVKRSEP